MPSIWDFWASSDFRALVAAAAGPPAGGSPELVACLILADWVADHGEPDWGDLIRTQVQMAGEPQKTGTTGRSWNALRQRAVSLLARGGPRWFPPAWFGGVTTEALFRVGPDALNLAQAVLPAADRGLTRVTAGLPREAHVGVCRLTPARVRGLAAAGVRVVRSIDAQPVSGWEVWGKTTGRESDYCWRRADADRVDCAADDEPEGGDLPAFVWDQLRGHTNACDRYKRYDYKRYAGDHPQRSAYAALDAALDGIVADAAAGPQPASLTLGAD